MSYLIFTNTNSNLFVVRHAKIPGKDKGKIRFGKLWKCWCCEEILETQYRYAKENKVYRIGPVQYKMSPGNQYQESGETKWYDRVRGLTLRTDYDS